jgi:hypothetical protein
LCRFAGGCDDVPAFQERGDLLLRETLVGHCRSYGGSGKITYFAERNRKAMRIGLDFDNTIVDYGAIFCDIAIEAGFAPSGFRGGKRELRNFLREQPSGEDRWQRVQAQAYGPRLIDAKPFAGVERFVAHCRGAGVPLVVISHKSSRAAAAPTGVDLRWAAATWLEAHFGDSFEGVFFEDSRRLKIERIASTRCSHVIDDLAEVFTDAAFPRDVVRWLFDPDGGAAIEGVDSFATWGALLERLEEERLLHVRVARLIGQEARSVLPCRGGANNRVYRVDTVEEEAFAVKAYGERDDRGRLRREFGALAFLRGHGVDQVAEAVASDPEYGLAAYAWVAGEPIAKYGTADVRAAVAFLRRIDALRTAKGASELPAAADAATSAGELWRQIDERFVRLQEIAAEEPAVEVFLTTFSRVAERVRAAPGSAATEPLPRDRQTLSPSDFGFHNALRRQGRLVFLDFEYFGWDDPVKLTADFVLHPGMDLTSADTKEWLDGLTAIFGRDGDFAGRLDRLYPVLALKWCLIILNEFLPMAWARRVASGRRRHAGAAKAEQLAKAAARLERISRGESIDGRFA